VPRSTSYRAEETDLEAAGNEGYIYPLVSLQMTDGPNAAPATGLTGASKKRRPNLAQVHPAVHFGLLVEL
jgi:hypothetical protein